jgi:cell division protein FtsI (penicillin-binding protein 3)
MKSRVIVLFIFIVGLFSLELLRVFYLQIMPNENLAKLKRNQFLSRMSLLPHRGKILDRNNEELASSVTTYSLYADPQVIETPRRYAKKLAPVLGLTVSELYEKLSLGGGKRFVWLKRQMEPEKVQKIKSFEFSGLGFVEEGKRNYVGAGAAQVLGVVGLDGNGLEGLEKKYDPELRGEKLSILSKRDAHGRPLVVSGQIFETSNDGATIETTIDRELQYELEHQLQNVLEAQEAERAMGIIMDPNTGEILAMASVPSFDPNETVKSNSNKNLLENRRNHVVTDIFEPGSTFKIITAAAALRTGRIHPNTKYFCENGKMKIGKRWIHEAEGHHQWQNLSLAQIIEVSSNIGSTKVAFDVGEKLFREMISDFGFGRPTGIDFPGEANGIIEKGSWNEHLLSNISFGHGVGVTALQLANAYSTIANGGKMMKPYLVKRIMDHQGNAIQEAQPQIIKNVLTSKEASTLTLMLAGVTQEGGTGTAARVDGYPVAGKTGTAQKVNPEGS